MWWGEYNLFRQNAFDEFWHGHLQEDRKILFVVGRGFDPRALVSLNRIISQRPEIDRHCIAIEMSNCFDTDGEAVRMRDTNEAGLRQLFAEDRIEIRDLTPTDTDGIRDISRATAHLFADVARNDAGFSDIVLDISTLPRLVYLTLLNQLLGAFVRPSDQAPLASSVNLHVVYGESAVIDRSISKREVDVDLAPLASLGIRLEEEASHDWPKIWFPILAEDVAEQLERIHSRIAPDDVCPVLPLQSVDPRRSDNIIREMGELVFDRMAVTPRDIIFATEWNPFQLYRSLLEAMDRYEESLKFFGGARFIISPLSSKSLSIGCLLALVEKRAKGDRAVMRVGMAHIETRRYEANDLGEDLPMVPISLWLTGDCYKIRTAIEAVNPAAPENAELHESNEAEPERESAEEARAASSPRE